MQQADQVVDKRAEAVRYPVIEARRAVVVFKHHLVIRQAFEHARHAECGVGVRHVRGEREAHPQFADPQLRGGGVRVVAVVHVEIGNAMPREILLTRFVAGFDDARPAQRQRQLDQRVARAFRNLERYRQIVVGGKIEWRAVGQYARA